MNSESTPATQLNQPEEPRQDPVLKSKPPITSFRGTPGWVKQLNRFPKRAEERNPNREELLDNTEAPAPHPEEPKAILLRLRNQATQAADDLKAQNRRHLSKPQDEIILDPLRPFIDKWPKCSASAYTLART
ncbi:hypothetical protein EBZ37_14325 [bacterium]|nr:hypothetical protein [bacterium]